MTLKHKIEKLEDVPEAMRGFYEAGTGGFFLQVEGMVPKTQLDEFRNTNIEVMRERDELRNKFKDVDPTKYLEYKAAAEKTPEAIDNAVKARVAQLRQEHEQQLNDVTAKYTAASQQLDILVVDGSLRGEATKHGILPTAIDDVILRGRTVFRRMDGQLLAVNEKGEKLYDKDGTSPLSVESWVKDLKKSAPHLFEGMRGSGAQGAHGGSGGTRDMAQMTSTEKIALGLAQMDNAG